MLMKKILFFFATLLIVNNSTAQQTVAEILYHENIQREFNVYLPINYVEGESLPLVFNFHGLTSNMAEQQFYSEMDVVANANNFIVCYPNGINESWNSGFGGSIDDVGFTEKMIGFLHEKYNIDLTRIYSCGMSNGGYMSYALSCELSSSLAAIASVTGSMTLGYMPICNPDRILPFMQIHGTNDNTVEYEGDGVSAAIPDVVNFWLDKNECAPITSNFSDILDIDTTDESTATNYKYFCNDELIGEQYIVENGAHTWPGASFVFDVTCQDFDSSEVIWEFFSQFSTENPATPIVGINIEKLVNKISIQPNPFKNFIYIDSEINIEQIEIYNIAGLLLKAVNTYSNKIDLSDFENGLYYLHLKSDEGSFTKTLIKK